MSKDVQSSLNLINEFLAPVRDRMAKEAAADNSVSFKDTTENQIEKMEEPVTPATEQETIGNEQSEAAKDSNSNVEEVAPNSETDGEDFADDQGPQTLGTDNKVTDEGNMDAVRQQKIDQEQTLGKTATLEQKEARATQLSNAILTVIQKQASEDEVNGDAAPEGTMATNYTSAVAKDGTDGDGGDLTAGLAENKEASEEDILFAQLDKVASEAASDYHQGYLYGLLKRAQDEMEVSSANIDPAVLEKVGGVSGLLDKVATETPEAILPAEELPIEGAEEMPEYPAEGGEEVPAELEEVAAALEEAGVTPEELEQAFSDVQALQEAGVSPEELGQALTEMGGEELPVEGGVEELPKEASAVNRQRIDSIKAYLQG